MKVIIFDFDGTIADSFSTVISIFHELTNRKTPVTQQEIELLKHSKLTDVAKNENIATWRVPLLLMRGRKMMSGRLHAISVFNGLEEVIEKAHLNGFNLYIMSSNSTNNIQYFLNEKGLSNYFTKIYGGIGILSKARALKRILRVNNLGIEECIYIGDEIRDIEACKTVGVRCISVSWGYNAKDMLEKQNPNNVVDTPKELITTIMKNK